MKTEIIIHASDYAIESESIGYLVKKNIEWKLDIYIKKHNKWETPVRLELSLEREKNHKAKGKLVISFSSHAWRSEREDFDNVQDLVNHLFTHIKDQLSSK